MKYSKPTNDFIKLTTVISKNGLYNKSYYLRGDWIKVRLSTIMQITEPFPVSVWENSEDGYGWTASSKDKSVPPTEMCSKIYTSTLHGLGINGVSSNILVDEESYKRLCSALNIMEN